MLAFTRRLLERLSVEGAKIGFLPADFRFAAVFEI